MQIAAALLKGVKRAGKAVVDQHAHGGKVAAQQLLPVVDHRGGADDEVAILARHIFACNRGEKRHRLVGLPQPHIVAEQP